MRILVVEDDRQLAAAIGQLLEDQHYSVDLAYDGETGLNNALTDIYDAVVLDVMLPKMDGFTVVSRLRAENNQTPVLMLTARSGTADKVQGLDSGADYYLTKPFETPEFLAAVRAVARRQGEVQGAELTYGDLVLDRETYMLSNQDAPASSEEGRIRLGNKEFQLMELLIAAKGRVVPKETMLIKVWGIESDAEDNNVEVYISFLRRKLEYLDTTTRISTMRNVGYYLRRPDEAGR